MNLLPDQIRVLERGWLSSNNVVFHEGTEATLVDSGYLTHAEQTLALVERALEGRRLARLVNTHSHSDHIGGNASVRRAHGCRISVPEGMAPAVRDWDEDALLLTSAYQRAEPFEFDATIAPGDELEMGGIAWQALHVPGHDMHALAYYAPAERILISGDALWRDGFGVMFAELHGDSSGLPAQRRTLELLRELDVRTVIPGHGAPFAEFDDALERAFARIRAFEDDGARMARNAIRACITFKLLEVRSMALAELPRHLDETPLYRTANARYLGLDADALAAWLVKELERAGVARSEDGALVVL